MELGRLLLLLLLNLEAYLVCAVRPLGATGPPEYQGLAMKGFLNRACCVWTQNHSHSAFRGVRRNGGLSEEATYPAGVARPQRHPMTIPLVENVEVFLPASKSLTHVGPLGRTEQSSAVAAAVLPVPAAPRAT